MSSLSNELENALRSLVQELPAAIRTQNWEALEDDARQDVYKAVANVLLGKDNQTIAKALLNALADNRITPAEWRGILLNWAGTRVGNDPIAKDVLQAFSDGVLSKEEVIGILIKWARTQIKNDAIVGVIDGVSTFFNAPGAQKALTDYLAHAGLPDTIAQGISNAIATGKLTTQQIFQMLAAWASLSHEEVFADLLKQLSEIPGVTPEKAILAFVGNRLPAEVQTIFTQLLSSDWNGLLSTILGSLRLNLGNKVLSDIAGGKYRQAAFDEVTALLVQAGVKEQHAGPLLDAVIGLVTGTRSLFASGAESDAPELPLSLVVLWREVRSVIYATQLALKGGSIVPTQADAQPHVFLAAQIRFHTPLHLLVPPQATLAQRNAFANTLTTFLDVYFGERMISTFHDDNVSVVADSELKPDSDHDCEVVFDNVGERLK